MQRIIILFGVVLTLSACDQMAARHFGGSTEVKLPAGTKLVSATWKGDNLWYLTRPMLPTEVPEQLIFQESSAAGLVEGRVIFVEAQ